MADDDSPIIDALRLRNKHQAENAADEAKAEAEKAKAEAEKAKAEALAAQSNSGSDDTQRPSWMP